MAATVLEALKGINAYPIPQRTITEICARRGCSLSEEATKEVLHGTAFNLAFADLLCWLALAPNITQGGQSYSFSDEQRTQFRNRANSLYADFGAADEQGTPKTIYGYKGSRL